jgi:hypothetical protein
MRKLVYYICTYVNVCEAERDSDAIYRDSSPQYNLVVNKSLKVVLKHEDMGDGHAIR